MNDTPDAPKQSTQLVERGTMKARDIQVGSAGINFTNAGEVMAFANMMAQSGAAVRPVFRDNPGACLALIDDSIRFGMSPYALARGAYLVNDQLAYEAKIVAAIINARAPIVDLPQYEYEGEGNTLRCTVTVELPNGRKISQQSPMLGTIEPKNSPLWKHDPEQQLGYYTVRALSRRHFPHILAGIYDLEEAAYARATAINERKDSGLAGRVTDQRITPESGFSAEHVEQQLEETTTDAEEIENAGAEDRNGDGAGETIPATTDGAIGLADDERTELATFTAELELCDTQKEIKAAWKIFAEGEPTPTGALLAEGKRLTDERAALLRKAKAK